MTSRRTSRRTSPTHAAFGALALSLVACAQAASPLVSELPKSTSTGEAFNGLHSSALRSQTEPDLMAWDPASRANLATLRTQGVVAVRYHADGNNVELEILSNCIGAGTYTYSPYAATDTKIARDDRELFAQLPLGAASLRGKLRGGRALRTDYKLVGVEALPSGTTYDASDLRGAGCERATHVVSRMYLGGFAMVAGETRAIEASATVFGFGGGAGERAETEHLAHEGVPDACDRAQIDGKETPQCAVPLRVGLLAISGRAPGGCPSGSTFDGRTCVRREVVTVVECPTGTKLEHGACIASVSRACPSGTHFESDAGCVPDVMTPPIRRKSSTRGGDLTFYMDGGATLGFAWTDANIQRIVQDYGREVRNCVLDEHLEDEWSVVTRVTFEDDSVGARGTRSRAYHRGVEATNTMIGDALVTCASLIGQWPWPRPTRSALGPGEKAFVQIESGMGRE